MRRAGLIALTGVLLTALPAGVLRVTGADAEWEIELLRFAGLGLTALGGLSAVIHARAVAISGGGAAIRKTILAALVTGFLVTANEVFLFFAFAALMHLVFYLMVPVLDHQFNRAKVRAGIG